MAEWFDSKMCMAFLLSACCITVVSEDDSFLTNKNVKNIIIIKVVNNHNQGSKGPFMGEIVW